MKVLVISDTHGDDRNVIAALVREMPIDALLHLGDSMEDEDEFALCVAGEDIPVYMVGGNCDFYHDHPRSRVVELAGHRIFMTHGHLEQVDWGTGDLAVAALSNQCDIALYGHTHVPDLDDSDRHLLIGNPGSLSYPRQRGRRPTYMVLTLVRGKAPQAELREL